MSFLNFFNGMVVVITGASSGFGAEFARQLAPVADTLLLVALEKELLDSVKAELTSAHPALKVITFAVDLGDRTSRNAFCEELTRQYPAIDLLINNAGLGDTGRFHKARWDRMRKIFDVNVVALTALTHWFVPAMCNRSKGAILNVCSLAGVVPAPMLAVYSASKKYVSSFSEALRVEIRSSGVTVTTVCPGPVDTNFGLVANRNGKKSLQGPAWFKTTPAKVVSEALRGVARGRARVFPTFPALGFACLFSLLPLGLRSWLFLRFFQKKK